MASYFKRETKLGESYSLPLDESIKKSAKPMQCTKLSAKVAKCGLICISLEQRLANLNKHNNFLKVKSE